MAHFPYVSDNPYRLLGVGSALTGDELLRLSQAGLAGKTGLRSVFGDDDLPRCAEIAAALAGDSEQRTITRFFWPFHWENPPDTEDGLEAFVSPAEPALAGQIAFLGNWFAFLVASDAGRLESALDRFSDLQNDEAFAARLARLLQIEGESAANALSVVDAAKNAISAHLLIDACGRAAALWESGDSETALDLLRVICACRFGEDADRGLNREIVPIGERETARLRREIDAFDGHLEAVPNRSEFRLRRLAETVGGRVPAAGEWLETAEERTAEVILALREHAIVLANDRDDYDSARRILEQILALPLSPMQRRRGENDLAKLEKVEVVEKEHRIWKNIQPVASPPTLLDIGGFGNRLYGRRPFAGRADWYFTTLYLCALFVPVFPLARFLVSDDPSGSRHFQGRIPMTRGDRYHLFGSLALIVLFVVWAISDVPGVGRAEAVAQRSAPAARTPEQYFTLAKPPAKPAKPSPKSAKSVFTLTEPISRPVEPTPDAFHPPKYVAPPILESPERRRNRLVAQWKALERANDAALPDLRANTTELEDKDRELKERLSWLRKEEATLDRSDERAVNDHNSRAKILDADGREVDRRWQIHERDIDAYNQRVDRIAEITRALGEMED